MITAVRTFAAVALATAMLTVSAPAANASSGYWTCAEGDYVFISDGWGYNVNAGGCVGQGSGDGPIIITSGYWAGNYYCTHTMVYGSGVLGMHCVPF